MSDMPPLRAAIIPVTPLQQNCTLLWCTKTMRGAFVDPGGDLPRLKAAAAQNGVTIEKILLTHAHIDHAGGTAELARKLNVPIEGPHPGDQFWIDQMSEQGRMFGFGRCDTFAPDRWLDDGDKRSLSRAFDLEIASLDERFVPA